MRGFIAKYYNWTFHGEESVPEYFEAATALPMSEEPTPLAHVEANNHPHWGDEQHMDWAQRMVLDAVRPSYFSSSHDGVPDDVGNKILPYGHTLPGDYYNTKKLIKDLGLPIEKIGVWLYYLRATAEHMMWHATHQTRQGSMCHPSDDEASKHSDYMYPNFANDPRNFRLPQAAAVVHVGVRTYGHATDNEFIMRQALMCTVNDLPAYGMASGWSTTEVMGFSICMDDTMTFHLQHGRKACYFDCHRQFLPVQHRYQRNNKAFTKNRVQNKAMDHKWTKKSIFWDLPYWSTLMIRHNLDVMHIEKNIFDNIFNTVMNIKRKTKDNLNTHLDLKSICNRPELELELDEHRSNVMPKAAYTLSKEQKRRVREWIKGLKVPDGYASNLARCVDMMNCICTA
ncbi:UNVERIFIED_CONTAM: hypothetical protein Sradi_5288100 [Sesamum radiatum]|uniref:Uncharacterized protein n=1 Tax=Sesamum radiatum TaxID=300843 RepID=A0AAW2LMF4_SESRA